MSHSYGDGYTLESAAFYGDEEVEVENEEPLMDRAFFETGVEDVQVNLEMAPGFVLGTVGASTTASATATMRTVTDVPKSTEEVEVDPLDINNGDDGDREIQLFEENDQPDVKPDLENILAQEDGNQEMVTVVRVVTATTTATSANKSQEKSGNPFKSKTDFNKEMEKSITDIIRESIHLLQKDPRVYHPFYLRIFKYLVLGEAYGYLNLQNKRNLENEKLKIWQKYDNLARDQFQQWKQENPKVKKKGNHNRVEMSPYATFILQNKLIHNGKPIPVPQRDESECQRRLRELEAIAKKMVKDDDDDETERKRKRSTSRSRAQVKTDHDPDPILPLEARLKFFQHCQTIAFPSDCKEMNVIWSSFAKVKKVDNTEGPSPQRKKMKFLQQSSSKPKSNCKNEQVKAGVKNCQKSKFTTKSQLQLGVKLKPRNKLKSLAFKLKRAELLKLERKRKLEVFMASRKPKIKAVPVRTSAPSGGSSNSKPIFQKRPWRRSKLEIESISNASRVVQRRRKRRMGKMPEKWRKFMEADVEAEAEAGQSQGSGSIPEDGKFTCPVCSNRYSIKQLWTHYTLHHTAIRQEIGKVMRVNELQGPDQAQPDNNDILFNDLLPLEPEGAEEIHVCEQCGEDFPSRSTLQEHAYNRHERPELVRLGPTLYCEHCSKPFKTKDSLNGHIRQVHFGLNFRCDVGSCTRICQSAGKLWRHKTEDHNISPNDLPIPQGLTLLLCDFCGEKLFRGLEAHVRRQHPEKLKEFKFKEKSNARSNQEKQTLMKRENRKLFKEMGEEAVRQGLVPAWYLDKTCSHCHKKVPSREFARHLRNFHGIGEKKTWPHVWSTSQKPGLYHPRKSSKHGEGSKVNLHGCPQAGCPESFKSMGALEKHFARSHGTLTKRIEAGRLIKVWTSSRYVTRRSFRRLYICGVCDDFGKCNLEEVKLHLITNHCDAIVNVNVTSGTTTLALTKTKTAVDSMNLKLDELELLAPPPPPPQRLLQIPKFMCPHCCKDAQDPFASEGELLRHVETLHPDMCVPCPECSKILVSSEAMSLHFLQEHNEDNDVVVPMEIGGSSGSDQTTSQGEAIQPNRELPQVDIETGARFYSGGRLSNMRAYSPEKTFPRRLTPSGQRFMSRRWLCHRCPQKFYEAAELRSHVEENHPLENFPCHNCDMLKHTARGLQLHMKKSHREIFRDPTNPKWDAKTLELLTTLKPYEDFQDECPVCEKSVRVGNYSRHLRSTHGFIANTFIRCDVCSKDFVLREVYLTHMEEAHGHEVDMKEVIEKLKGVVAVKELDTSKILHSKRPGVYSKSRPGSKVKLGNGNRKKRSTKQRVQSDQSDSDWEFSDHKQGRRKSSAGVQGPQLRSSRARIKKEVKMNENVVETRPCFVLVERMSQDDIDRYLKR